jgi:hypothetical protein
MKMQQSSQRAVPANPGRTSADSAEILPDLSRTDRQTRAQAAKATGYRYSEVEPTEGVGHGLSL